MGFNTEVKGLCKILKIALYNYHRNLGETIEIFKSSHLQLPIPMGSLHPEQMKVAQKYEMLLTFISKEFYGTG